LGRFLEIDAEGMKSHQSLLLEQEGVQGAEKEVSI
jgi:hypothetical protein